MQILKVPCGQCIGCRMDRSLMWATRCMHESKAYDVNSFVTLTYSDEHLPKDMSLSVRESQLFFKRLRKAISPRRIKYFLCGEYSPPRPRYLRWDVDPDTAPEGLRPHYHAAVFNLEIPDRELWSVRDGIRLYSSDFLSDLWRKGFCTVGDLTFESAAYVARYNLKKINGPLEELPDARTGLLPYERVCPVTGNITEVAKEFVTMSNGIGGKFFEQYVDDMYPRDYVVINGHKAKTPRYYDNKYETLEPRIMEEIKERRMAEMERHAADNTPDRLRARERVKEAQINLLKREAIQ
jgi:hypothetical protein